MQTLDHNIGVLRKTPIFSPKIAEINSHKTDYRAQLETFPHKSPHK
jgi:hypothetical protein